MARRRTADRRGPSRPRRAEDPDLEARFTVRVRPGASHPRVGGTYGPAGDLVVAVREPALDGRANRAVVAAVAQALGVRPSQVRLVAGATARSKVLAVDDPAPDLPQRLDRLRADADRGAPG